MLVVCHKLLARIPVGAFIDHGANRELGNPGTEQGWVDYQKVIADQGTKRINAKVGDILPIRGFRAQVREFRW